MEWPNHPLYVQLCNQASDLLPLLGFKELEVSESSHSFISNDGLIVTIQHGGYDMPDILFGYKKVNSQIRSWGPLEYYIDKQTPIYNEHTKMKSIYEFEYHNNLLSNYYQEILKIAKAPKDYLIWEANIDIEKLIQKLNGNSKMV